MRDRRQLIYLKPTVVNNVSDARKRCTKDLGGIRASCLLLGMRVCFCVVLLFTHTEKEGFTRRVRLLTSSRRILLFDTLVWF